MSSCSIQTMFPVDPYSHSEDEVIPSRYNLLQPPYKVSSAFHGGNTDSLRDAKLESPLEISRKLKRLGPSVPISSGS
jgi:hypothetical protein